MEKTKRNIEIKKLREENKLSYAKIALLINKKYGGSLSRQRMQQICSSQFAKTRSELADDKALEIYQEVDKCRNITEVAKKRGLFSSSVVRYLRRAEKVFNLKPLYTSKKC